MQRFVFSPCQTSDPIGALIKGTTASERLLVEWDTLYW